MPTVYRKSATLKEEGGENMYKKVSKYFLSHPVYNAATHALLGLGIGILITYPFIDHPVRWGAALVILGLAAHVYPLTLKK